MRRAEGALLLVFEGLTRAPSKECGRCLLTKFGLAQFTARLGFWKLGYERHLAFNIFDAVPPHPVAGGYTRPIHTPHKALPLNTRVHSKAAGEEENRRLCLSAPNDAGGFPNNRHRRGCRTGGATRGHALRPPPRTITEDARSDEAIIRPRFAVWYKLGAMGSDLTGAKPRATDCCAIWTWVSDG